MQVDVYKKMCLVFQHRRNHIILAFLFAVRIISVDSVRILRNPFVSTHKQVRCRVYLTKDFSNEYFNVEFDHI